MSSTIGLLFFTWFCYALSGSFKSTRASTPRIRDGAFVYRRMKLGMSPQELHCLVGTTGAQSQSSDDSGQWLTASWRDRQNRYLRATFHNEKLVDWSLC